MLIPNFSLFGQLNTPHGIQQVTIFQHVGVSDVIITYSRPLVNDFEIWGKLVPYGINNPNVYDS